MVAQKTQAQSEKSSFCTSTVSLVQTFQLICFWGGWTGPGSSYLSSIFSPCYFIWEHISSVPSHLIPFGMIIILVLVIAGICAVVWQTNNSPNIILISETFFLCMSLRSSIYFYSLTYRLKFRIVFFNINIYVFLSPLLCFPFFLGFFCANKSCYFFSVMNCLNIFTT